MLNVWDPCLMVITRCPRRCSSAQSRTVSVVLPLCFLPITATIGGRGMVLRERKLIRGVDVHEEALGIPEATHQLGVEPRQTNVIVEPDHSQVAAIDLPLDRGDTRWRVIRAQRLDAAARTTLRHRGVRVVALAEVAQRREQT